MNIAIIAAVADNRVIGDQGKIPWHLPADLRHFKELTIGKTVIMGRRTFESITDRLGGLLPNRQTIILSRAGLLSEQANQALRQMSSTTSCRLAGSLDDALRGLPANSAEKIEVMIAGGAEIYTQALPRAERLYLTEVHAQPPGDAYFPAFDAADWQVVHREEHLADQRHRYAYTFTTLDQKRPGGTGAFVDPTYVRSVSYRETMAKILAAGHCPFCPGSFIYHPHPILRHEGKWFITRINEPYPNARVQLLIIGEEHKETFCELTVEDLASVRELVGWAIREFSLAGGGFALRFGDTTRTGATIRHLHFHLIEPELDATTGRAIPVTFPIG